MKKTEVSGRTLEEAVQMAARELGVSTDAVDYEIVEEGTKGFLGLGQSPTVITAWVREGYVAPVKQPAPARPEYVAQEEIEEKPEVEVTPVETKAQEPVAAPGEMQDFINVLLPMLSDIVGAMGLDAKPVVKLTEPEEVVIDIEGKDVGMLVGKQGQTLDALQYLVSIAANRSAGTRLRVILDADGYRDRHKDLLEQKAHEYAKAVKEAGQEAVLEPQSARDRRIVHLTLADDPDVYTYSEGEGDNRHVVISPKK